MNNPTPDTSGKPAGRIRQKNMKAILAAAAEEFAVHGFKGTSMNAIAQRVNLPKANLHYYFGSKEGLYTALLEQILNQWGQALDTLDDSEDPARTLAEYIRAKLEFSRTEPLASRIFAIEVISGGLFLTQHYGKSYKEWFNARCAVIQRWVDSSKISAIDPAHLLFLIWSSTQHYADFAWQAGLLLGHNKLTKADFKQAGDTLVQIILKGCGLTPPAQ